MNHFSPIRLEGKSIIIRQAGQFDSGIDAGKLIYLSDPSIFPFWFGNNEALGNIVLSGLFSSPSGFFSWQNSIVAIDQLERQKVIGIPTILEDNRFCDYDYDLLKRASPGARYAINHHVEPKLAFIKTSAKKTLLITDLCVDPNYREQGIATQLMHTVVREATCQHYQHIKSFLPTDQPTIAHLYEAFGFKCTGRSTHFAIPGRIPTDAYNYSLSLTDT